MIWKDGMIMAGNIIPVSKDFGERLAMFIEHFAKWMSPSKVSYEMGTKYVKVLTGPYGKQQIHAFIDFSGNLYHPLTEKMPKKKVAATIYDDDFGLKRGIDPIGISYVR
jgi:hypothetical protein